jgi:hypothetical protein
LDLLHLYTELLITSNAAPLLVYILEFTVIHKIGFLSFTSRILATDFKAISITLSLQLQQT